MMDEARPDAARRASGDPSTERAPDHVRADAALHEIRALELEMAHRLEEARTSAAASIGEARTAARRAIAAARELGTRRGDELHRTRVGEARVQAEGIRATGESQAGDLLERLRPQVRALVDEMVEIVLTTADDSATSDPVDESGRGW